MIEQSTENAFSKDNGVKAEQPKTQNSDKLLQKSLTNDVLPAVIQLSKQIKDLDKKNTRIEESISSITKDIKNAVMTVEANHQLESDGSARIMAFHDQIAKLQMQTQKIEQVINSNFKSKKSKKVKEDKKRNNKGKKRNNKDKNKDKKSKKKAKNMKKKQK
ncbi:MAG: hypothetical protein WBQ25_19915 [Nitrososphaeraceae archaeon]